MPTPSFRRVRPRCPPRRLLVRRLPALRRDRRTGRGDGCRAGPRGRGAVWSSASATASRSCAIGPAAGRADAQRQSTLHLPSAALRVERNDTRFTWPMRRVRSSTSASPTAKATTSRIPRRCADRGRGPRRLPVLRRAGALTVDANRNGSLERDRRHLLGEAQRLGLMPHPENFVEGLVGGTDGRGLFESLAA